MAAVLAPDATAVGVTTGLVGAGGFGKTTLARMVAHDPRVRAEFSDGVVWVTVGEDAGALDLAAKLVSAARLFDPTAAEVTDPQAAGAVLGRVLSGRRVLLVVDDVWSTAQVEPFLVGGEGAVRLFTTRQPGVLPGRVAPVRVDQMTGGQARRAAHRRPTGVAGGAGGGGVAGDGAVAGVAGAGARRRPGRGHGGRGPGRRADRCAGGAEDRGGHRAGRHQPG